MATKTLLLASKWANRYSTVMIQRRAWASLSTLGNPFGSEPAGCRFIVRTTASPKVGNRQLVSRPISSTLAVAPKSGSHIRSFSSQPPAGSGGGGMQLPPWMHPESNTPGHHLSQYCTDLTELASQNKLDPVIGREEEIRRCLQILARRTKSNPVLIGEAGVGKTAIAEGLAQRLHHGDVPESMKSKRVLSLDMAALMAGAGVRGQFEQRVKGILKDIAAANGNVILFLDELHTLVNAGKSEGSMDMGNMLKPALARGDMQLLGATTLDEYRIIEKDPALTRRLQTVFVKEPSVQDTLSILRGLKTAYELHHSIRIKDEALVAAATLSDRYLTDRHQPDKSIDLVDEACSRLRLEQESKPEIIWKVERDLMTRQIELSALQNEQDADDKIRTRRDECAKTVETLKAEVKRLTAAWMAEKVELGSVQEKKGALEEARRQAARAERQGNYAQAAEIKYSVIPTLESELEALESSVESAKKHKKMLADSVTADQIATIIARHTGIPVSRITGDESHKLLHIEEKLRNRVVGQDHALTAVSNCVRLARTRLQAQDRTLGNFLFLGPTGVGKTETAKALAEFIFDDENAMTRIDMSEYSEKHSVSRLIGAPPGYIGYEEAGALTESVRRRPYQILLLDEFEKAHREIWNILLSLFDEGHLTDSHGRKVDFRNVIVIMTSNLGAQVISELPEHLRGSEPEVHSAIMEIVRHTLSPELLNRIDETVVFNRLQRENMDRIAEIGIGEVAKRLEDGQNMALDVSQNARIVLAEMGYDVRYGARPLKRVLARELLNPMSRLVLEGALESGDTVRVRTRAEAIQTQKAGEAEVGWISSNSDSDDMNDVVILRNRKKEDVNPEEVWDDEEYLLEDGTHGHR